MNRALLTSKSTLYGTPQDFYDLLNRNFHFTIDLCALPSNAKHARFWSPKENALAQSWEGETGFGNWPYGRGIGDWCEKARDSAIHERAVVVQLLPARVDTSWWKTFIMSTDKAAGRLLRSVYVAETTILWLRWEGLVTGVYFHNERLPFSADGVGDPAPFPSAVVIHASPSRRLPPPELEPEDLDLTLGWPR